MTDTPQNSDAASDTAGAPDAPPPAEAPEALPDRLSNNPKSRFYDEALLGRGIGILLNGKERENVDEYCVSEGWIRIAVGRSRDRNGYPITTKINGAVEPFIKPPPV
jgi:hypothetical protein